MQAVLTTLQETQILVRGTALILLVAAEQWASTREGVEAVVPEQAYGLIQHITRQIRR